MKRFILSFSTLGRNCFLGVQAADTQNYTVILVLCGISLGVLYEFLYFYVKIRRLSCMILNDSAEFSDNIFEDNGILYIFSFIVFPDFLCGYIASFAHKKCRKNVDRAENTVFYYNGLVIDKKILFSFLSKL